MNGPALKVMLQSPWLLEESMLGTLAEIVVNHENGLRLSKEEIDLRIKAAQAGKSSTVGRYQVVNGVAIIPIHGVIEKRSSWFSDVSGMTSTMAIERDLQAALGDKDVKAILLDIESPGGSVDGVSSLADAVFAARKVKKVWAYANGLMCSAAYWIGCQAEQIYASKTAAVGSIGVYTVLYDLSQAALEQGVKVKVVKAGAMKGTGIRGTEVTDTQLSDVQRYINQIYELFVTAVAVGRNLSESQALALADGRIHIGENAKALNLVDGIESFDNVLSKLSAQNPVPPRGGNIAKGEIKMSEPVKATITELKAAFPDDLAFAVEQFEKGATLVQAKADYADVLRERSKKQNEEHEKAMKAKDEELTKVKTESSKKPGVKPLGSGTQPKDDGDQPDGSAKDAFMAKVDELVGKGVPREKAVSQASAKYPDLHKAMLAEANGGDEAIEARERAVASQHGKKWI